MNTNEFMQDDFIFKPYPSGGYQSIVMLSIGRLSIRCKSNGLFIDKNRPYEVWYPTDDVPTGYQTGEDIWNYIKKVKQIKKTPENYLELEAK